jgi:dTDP-4-dehydrorhamnose reductase
MITQKKILITGAKGLLGTELVNTISLNSNYEVKGVDFEDFDITDKDVVMSYVKNYEPDYIIHSAGYTKVDDAEKEKDLCFSVNETGTYNLALSAKEIDCVFVYFSTDFVFDGNKKEAYVETDEPNPISVYGLSKLKGEEAVIGLLDKYFIFRISWLYGEYGKNFVSTIKNIAEKRDEISVVKDQIGCPTYSKDISDNIMAVITTNEYGIYNMVGEGQCSWYEFACEIVKILGLDVKVIPILSDKMPRPAKRPCNSCLNCGKLNNLLTKQVMPFWQKSLEKFLI